MLVFRYSSEVEKGSRADPLGNAMLQPSRKTSKSSKSILLDLRDEDYQYKNRGGDELQSASLTASGSLIPPVSPVKRLKR